MSKKSRGVNKKLRKKKTILIVEIIVLAVLCVAAFGSHWLNSKLGLVNYNQTDEDKLITADELNGEESVDLTGKDLIALVGLARRDG